MEVSGKKLTEEASSFDAVGSHELTNKRLGVQTEGYVDVTNFKFTPSSSIPVKDPSDAIDCWLTSMLLLPMNRLLLTDYHNETVKLVDLETSRLVSQVRVPGGPCDMCLLPGDRVAVTLTSGKIQFLETRGEIALGANIRVDSDCQGIGYHNDRLILSYYSGKVEMMDMKTTKKIDTVIEESMFCDPEYLAVIMEDQTAVIYVSDFKKNTISKLDMDLNLIQTFQNPALRAPTSILLLDNHLIICGFGSDNIMRLDLPSGQLTQVLGKNEGINWPRSVCYSQQYNKLYVTCTRYDDNGAYVK
ncbi:uncharacterized protein LOC128237909 [Mya arenaria]|uniref:uncharacterized protein LOC128237909 n=1 Tax=Mya arenaria TaxID=6604 RepID=UPI0022E400C0|nr:uncharacterized protein LOC128237909 [Mya arenaria]